MNDELSEFPSISTIKLKSFQMLVICVVDSDIASNLGEHAEEVNKWYDAVYKPRLTTTASCPIMPWVRLRQEGVNIGSELNVRIAVCHGSEHGAQCDGLRCGNLECLLTRSYQGFLFSSTRQHHPFSLH